jgi:parallel beta-helix repeat protein
MCWLVFRWSAVNVIRGARIYSNGIGKGLDHTSACVSGGGGVVLGDANNSAEDNLVYENLEGILVFGFKPSSGARIQGNTVYGNVVGSREQ